MDELHERMLEDLYTLIGFENAGREELCFFLRSAEEKALRFTRQWELIGGMPTIVVEIAAPSAEGQLFRTSAFGTHYFLQIAATPGSSLPSMASSSAPPPVEM